MSYNTYLHPLRELEEQHRYDLNVQLAATTDYLTRERCVQTVAAMDRTKEIAAWASGMVDTLAHVADQLEELTRSPDDLAAALRVLPCDKVEALQKISTRLSQQLPIRREPCFKNSR